MRLVLGARTVVRLIAVMVSQTTITTTATTTSAAAEAASTMELKEYNDVFVYGFITEREAKSISNWHAHTCMRRTPSHTQYLLFYWSILTFAWQIFTINTDVLFPLNVTFSRSFCISLNDINVYIKCVSNLNVFSIRHHRCFASSNRWLEEREKIG